uniref:Uncharacterized protein n=1 Tax=Arundo donax TaxID=35708 RepID=A0A0A9CI80_ARUDO
MEQKLENLIKSLEEDCQLQRTRDQQMQQKINCLQHTFDSWKPGLDKELTDLHQAIADLRSHMEQLEKH